MKYKDLLKVQIEDCGDLGKARREHGIANISKVLQGRELAPPTFPLPDGPWDDDLGSSAYLREVGYATGSGNVMSMLVEGFPIHSSSTPLLTEYEQVAFCGDCKGSSGGCPGFAPRFDTIFKRYEHIVVIAVSFDYMWSIMYATPRNGWLARRIIKQMVYADRLTESYCNRMIKYAGYTGVGYALGLGNCRGCAAKHCTVIRGERCVRPKKRTFSMEATGVDCDELHKRFYGEYLPWYYKGTAKIPTYMTRYIGIFPKDSSEDVLSVVEEFIRNDRSFVSMDDVPEPRDATIELQRVPSGPHIGSHQYVYNDPGGVEV